MYITRLNALNSTGEGRHFGGIEALPLIESRRLEMSSSVLEATHGTVLKPNVLLRNCFREMRKKSRRKERIIPIVFPVRTGEKNHGNGLVDH